MTLFNPSALPVGSVSRLGQSDFGFSLCAAGGAQFSPWQAILWIMDCCEVRVLWELWGGAVTCWGPWVPWLCIPCSVWPCVMGSLCLHQELLGQGCVFQERQGWERPGWFNPQETAQVSKDT